MFVLFEILPSGLFFLSFLFLFFFFCLLSQRLFSFFERNRGVICPILLLPYQPRENSVAQKHSTARHAVKLQRARQANTGHLISSVYGLKSNFICWSSFFLFDILLVRNDLLRVSSVPF